MTTPANPDDLTAWLQAQLDEDERVARAARELHPGDWIPSGAGDISAVETLPSGSGAMVDGVGSAKTGAAAVHMAEHGPARVLAEVDAKRRIMAIHHPKKFEGLGGLPQICDGCGYGGICDDPITEDINGCPILRLLALPFADRPGYREEWRLA